MFWLKQRTVKDQTDRDARSGATVVALQMPNPERPNGRDTSIRGQAT